MIAIAELNRTAQRAVFMLVAVVMVMANIGLGAIVAQSAQPDYTVTITQLS